MNLHECMTVLKQLATDMGYQVESGFLHGIGARTKEEFGKRKLIIDEDTHLENSLRCVSKCLQNDPQLAWYALDDSQEQALQTGSAIPFEADQDILPLTPAASLTANWPESTTRRKAS